MANGTWREWGRLVIAKMNEFQAKSEIYDRKLQDLDDRVDKLSWRDSLRGKMVWSIVVPVLTGVGASILTMWIASKMFHG